MNERSINIELFSCSGGMAEGFRRAGLEFDFVFDYDEDACDSYEKNLKHRPVRMDVRDLVRMAKGGWRSGAIGLLVADPPCTPWSRAGKRLGTADERDMLEETAELITLLRPRAYLIGNVPGLQDATKGWMLAQGYEHWTNVVGIRADEPRRIAKRAGRVSKERWDEALPLARAGVDVAEVRAFWAQQPFDLQLEPWEGNCDLCFLKGIHKRKRIMRDRPDLAPWWIGEERKAGGEFRGDAPSYARLFRIVDQQPLLLDSDPTDLGDCECDLEAA